MLYKLRQKLEFSHFHGISALGELLQIFFKRDTQISLVVLL